MSDIKTFSWNKNLFSDITSGACSGFIVAPIVSSVDKAMTENASGRSTLGKSFMTSMKDLCKQPITFLKSAAFRYVWLVYGSTYTAANVMESIAEYRNKADPILKLGVTTSVNTTCCIIKDRAYAQLFGAGNTGPVPMTSYGIWLMRDLLSMAAIFTLPPIVAKEVAKSTGNEQLAYYSAQFVFPLILQTVATPMHLLGFDVYNNPNNTLSQRLAFAKKDYFKNVGFRMGRMLAPWSLGTIGNRELRSGIKNKVY